MSRILIAIVAAALIGAPVGPVLAEDTSREFTFRRARAKPGTYPPRAGVLAEALDVDLAGVEEVIFAVRADGKDGHYYANFGYVITSPDKFKHGGAGGQLCALNLRTGEIRKLIDDPNGDVRDPAVSYDGRTILFAYRPGGTNQFHLYTIGVDGEGLTQLTSGPYDDMEPAWLPDGGIVFISSRCKRWVPCWYVQVAVLFRCDADGSNIRQLSPGPETENTPWPLPDGRVMYTRWEYVDRGQLHYHGLWIVNPDGSGVELLYDNMGTMNLYIDAKPIPGTGKIVTMISPLHGANEHRGRIGILDPAHGTESESAMMFLDRGFVPGKAHEDRKGRPSRWRDPYPVSPNCFLAAHHHGLAILNAAGDYEIIHELPDQLREKGLRLHEPRPVRPRPREPIIPKTPPSEDGMATFSVMDVTIGRNMDGIQPGQIKKLLVMEELPRPGANDMNPEVISHNGKNFLLHRILGTAPVEPDGSAHFKAPAGRALFFYALDANSLAAKAMPSWVSAVPGEQVSCVGCHEDKSHTPAIALNKSMTAALKRPPSRLEPIPGVPEIFDYVRDIQPIWDKHCVRCHNYEKHAGDLLLVGDMTPAWSVSYWEIKRNRTDNLWGVGGGLVSCHPGYEPDPYSAASGESKLVTKLRGGHKDVKLSPTEWQKLLRWIDAGTTFAGTYAALDSCSAKKNQIRLHKKRNDAYNARCKPIRDVLSRRCDGCHNELVKRPPWVTGEIRQVGHRFNLDAPDKSLLLLAPLAESAGGLAICKRTDRTPKDAPATPVFDSTDSEDFARLREMTRIVADQYDRLRWYQPGHVPTDWYTRELIRFGALPPGFDPADSDMTGYEMDRRYFEEIYRIAPGKPWRD